MMQCQVKGMHELSQARRRDRCEHLRIAICGLLVSHKAPNAVNLITRKHQCMEPLTATAASLLMLVRSSLATRSVTENPCASSCSFIFLLKLNDAALQLLDCGSSATAGMLCSCFLRASSSSHSIYATCSSLHNEQ
jgi:hypothetical protein